MTERPLDHEPPDGDAPPNTPDEDPSARRRSRWRTIGLPAAVIVAAMAAVGGVILADGSSGSAAASTATTIKYGTVAQTAVAQTQSLSGTIAYTATQTITNQFTPTASTASARSGPIATAILAAFVTSTSGSGGSSGSRAGSTGATGSGSTGATGSGSTGPTGTGAKGTTGTGAKGTTGKGAKGATGKGAKGTTGKGPKGATGKGSKGASSTGSKGAAGSSGSASGSGSSSSSSGTLTTMAAVGSTIKLGGTLYTVNEEPVVAMDGTLPAYRAMQDGDTGTDISQLQTSLEDLGYSPGTADGTFGASTLSAVEAWQKNEGLTVDGIVHLGQVVFVSGPSRVITQLGTIGAAVPPGSQILSVGPESPIVTTSESSSQLGLLSQDQTVDVQLPDGSVVAGKVTSVGAASSSSGGSGGGPSGGSGSGSSTTPVTVALNSPALGNSIAGSSVTVIVTTSRVSDVLAVPIAALVATSSGQLYVQVPNAQGALEDISVNPTVYDDTAGIAAVPGANLTPGERVVVAQT